MAIDDIYQVQWHHTYAGQKLMNSLAFRMKTATDPDAAKLTALATDWKNMMIAIQHSGVAYVSWVAQQVRGGTASYTAKQCQRDGGRRLEGLFTGSLVGTGANDGLPPQSSLVTTLYSGISGRTKRGRHYLSGISENDQAAGIWASARVTAIQAQWDAQLAQYGVGGTDPDFELGIWSMRIATGCVPGPVPPGGMIYTGSRDPAAAYISVNGAVVRPTVYSQRRRTIGVGR